MKLLSCRLTSLVLLMSCFFLTSCETEDTPADDSILWSGELADAPYASDAVCYEFGDDAPFQSIELTGSGLWFVTMRENSGAATNVSKPRFRAQSRYWAESENAEVLEGLFEPVGNNRYRLNNFGTVTYNSNTGELTIGYEEGGEGIYYVKAISLRYDSNVLNNRLCRTWTFTGARIEFINKDKEVVGSHTFTGKELDNEFIEYFTFTRSGNLYECDDSEWTKSSWRWLNAKKQLVGITGDGGYGDYEGVYQTLFNKNKMTIVEVEEYMSYQEIEWEYQDIDLNVPTSAVYTRLYLDCVPFSK